MFDSIAKRLRLYFPSPMQLQSIKTSFDTVTYERLAEARQACAPCIAIEVLRITDHQSDEYRRLLQSWQGYLTSQPISLTKTV
jgi:hypothetical protein